MARHRSILGLILAFFAVFVVSCTNPTVAKTPTYTPVKLEQIQTYANQVVAARDRMQELATLIENRDWNNVESFIHGPLGELRLNMSTLSRQLLPDAQKPALETARNVFGHLVRIDEYAQEGNYQQAIRNYAEALKDFDAFLDMVPKA